MASSFGRVLTSFGGTPVSAISTPPRPPGPSDGDGRYSILTALDFAHRAFGARDLLNFTIPSTLSDTQAIDSAAFVGQGATFAVYRRRLPPQQKIRTKEALGDASIEMDDRRMFPQVVAYKISMIEFSSLGEASSASRHAAEAAIMELHLATHRPIWQHRNIVDLLGLGWATNPFSSLHKLPVLIVEFAEHGSLADLQRREFLGIECRRRLCLDICRGISVLHSCGVVHGDVKAENILIMPDEEHKYIAKVSDFGYSLVIGDGRQSVFLGGTRPWKAPEAEGAIEVSEAKYADVYSLALLIWCTFAHGQNIFKLLLRASSHSESFHKEIERLKTSGDLASRTNLSDWYLEALMSSAYVDGIDLPEHFASLTQRLQRRGFVGRENLAPNIDNIEEVFCAFPSTAINLVGPPQKDLIIGCVENSGLYSGMQQAVATGLANQPTRRDLRQIMVFLGDYNSHAEESEETGQVLRSRPKWDSLSFSWHNWPTMSPSIQVYLTNTYIQRCQGDDRKGIIYTVEAFLLAALYINGYGVDKDTAKAYRLLSNAWTGGHKLSMAYGYRIGLAIGVKVDDIETVVNSLRSMALSGSRIALEDLARVSEHEYAKTRETLRNTSAGVGANFFSDEAMLHGNDLERWFRSMENAKHFLELLSPLDNVVEHKVNRRGDRILHLAASCGQTKAIEALLTHFTTLNIDGTNDNGETPLLCACRAGQTDTVLWLSSRGADASVGARNGESPLHWLVSFDDDEVNRVAPSLIKAGADVAAKTTTKIAYQAGFPATLISDRLPKGYPIAWAIHCDRPYIVRLLLSIMSNLRICVESWPLAHSALEIAASQLRAECLELIIRAAGERDDMGNKTIPRPWFGINHLLVHAVHGSSLMDMIMYHGPRYRQAMESTFRCLLPWTSQVSFLQGYGGFDQSLLYFAVSLARDEVVEYLLKHGIDAISSLPHSDEESLPRPDRGAFKLSDINRPCGDEMRTPLLEAVRWNRPRLVNILLDHGADTSAASRNPFSGQRSTWSVLHVLSYAGHNDSRLVQPLIQRGAPLDGFTNHYLTTESPLLIAVQNDSFELADRLVSLGADINFITMSSGHLTLENPTTILGHVIASNARNSIARLRYLLDESTMRDKIQFVVEPCRKWTALHRAAAADLGTAFRGTDATEQLKLEWSDVDWGANREILVELLRYFGSSEELDAAEQSMQLTAIHLAVLAGNEAAVELLLEHGARHDLLSCGVNPETAVDMAHRLQAHSPSVNGSSGYACGNKKEALARRRCNEILQG